MKKYRFLTEQELRDKGDWSKTLNMPLGWGTDRKILKLLGAEVPSRYLESCERGEYFYIDDFFLPRDSYKLIKEPVKQYRLKTEEEFQMEGRWWAGAPVSWNVQMIEHLGTSIPLKYSIIIETAIKTRKDFIMKLSGSKYWHYSYKDVLPISITTPISSEHTIVSDSELVSDKVHPTVYSPPMKEEKQRIEPMKNIR